MKKISDQDAQTLIDLVERYGKETLIPWLEALGAKGSGRPADLVLNTGIIWGHLEYLKLRRVVQTRKRLDGACAMLENYLERYTHGSRLKIASTLKKIYRSAPKAAISEPLVGLVMQHTLEVLEGELAGFPHKIPIPYLIEGVSGGWKYPTFDTHQFQDNAEAIVHAADDYKACLTFIVTPINN
jgi:hypothetical protein